MVGFLWEIPEKQTSALRGQTVEQVVIKTYAGNQSQAALEFQSDANKMAEKGYFPTSQSWAPGQWGEGAYFVAILLIFLFGLGILILGYMLVVKPKGTLTVTYELRAAVDEKTCPRCAERIKSAALVCHFCGYQFAPDASAGQPEITTRNRENHAVDLDGAKNG